MPPLPSRVRARALAATLVGLSMTPYVSAETVTVFSGSGGGAYDAGSEVFVSAYPCEIDCDESSVSEPSNPTAVRRIFDRWGGADALLLDNPRSARTRFTMPSRDVRLRAFYKTAPRWIPPTVLAIFPPEHHSVIFINHGAGGCALCLPTQPQTRYFIDDATSRGFAVVALDSFDQATKTWAGTAFKEPPSAADNIDMQRLAEARLKLIDDGRMRADDPVYLVGISNGGLFSSLFNAEAQAFLQFPIDAMALMISAGSPASVPEQTTPIFFVLGENDSKPKGTYAIKRKALTHFDALLQRGDVDTQLHIAREQPIGSDSFWRVEGLSRTDSDTIFQSLVTGQIIDSDGWLTLNPAYNQRWANWVPQAYAQKTGTIGKILEEHYTEHVFQNEFNDRLFAFLRDPTTSVDLVPAISAFTPKEGLPGTAITIVGENFVGIQSVTINNSQARIHRSKPDSITITVPELATTGLIRVTNEAGTGVSATSFDVTTAPNR